MSQFALSDSFEYLCYGSTAIGNISNLTVGGGGGIDFSHRRQMLMTKVDPRAVRVNFIISEHFQDGERLWTSESDVFSRQTRTINGGPCPESVKYF